MLEYDDTHSPTGWSKRKAGNLVLIAGFSIFILHFWYLVS